MVEGFKFTRDYLELEEDLAEFSRVLSEIAAKFNCRRCGECCTFDNDRYGPILTSSEYEYFGEVNTVWLADNKAYLKNPCPFFAGNSCKTNAYKPRVCRMHPFSFHSEKPAKLAIYNCELGKEILLNYLHFLRDVKKENIPETALQQVESSKIDSMCYSYVPHVENVEEGFELLKEFLTSYEKKYKN